jgi:hypothetical protein
MMNRARHQPFAAGHRTEIVRAGILALVTAQAVLMGPLAPRAGAQPAAAAETQAVPAQYGFAVRVPRYVTIPGWVLGLFSKENVPLHTFGAFGLEFVRRTNFDIVFAVGYQNLSTGDGNWLGRGKDPSFETDLVQFRDLSFIGADISFVNRRMLNQYFGVHGRAGLGVAIMRGKILRTSNSALCNDANAGDEQACRPIVCEPGGCTEEKLRMTEGRMDGGPTSPSRFEEKNVPGALPILNLAVGLDLRLPQWKGFEARLEGGFYNALFLGTAFGYMF